MTLAAERNRLSLRAIPPAALWLGMAGALPFVALATAAWLPGPAPGAPLSFALIAYGAVILSFLGGVRWGLAIAGYGAGADDGPSWKRLGLAVAPSLIAWFSLLIAAPAGLLTLAAAFAAMLAIDRRAGAAGAMPAWYAALRLPLSLVVVAALLLAAAAPGA